jgi:hypothetical protein
MALTPEQQALDFNPELQDVNRHRKLAELLMSQATQQPQGQMISGHYVAPSWTQQLQPMFNAAVGTAAANKADTQEQQMAEALRSAGQQEVQGILQTAQQDPKAALAMASSAKTPQARALAQSLMASVLPKKTDKLVEYDTYKAEGGKKTFSDWSKEITPEQQAKLDIDRQRLGLEGAKLNLEQKKVEQELQFGKPLTESQAKAAVFHSQMTSATNELNNVYQKGFNPNSPVAQAQTGIAGGMFNALISSAAQEAKQAQNQWTEAYLRFKTGAGTNANEVEANRKTYFPQVGDKPDAIAQKARMREQAEHDIAMAAGPQAMRMNMQPQKAPQQAPQQPQMPNSQSPQMPKKVVNFNDLQ